MRGGLFLFVLVFVLMGPSASLAASPPGFEENRNNGTAPVWRKRELTFDLPRGACQARPYGDGRGESDCLNGNSRSQVHTKRKQRLGREYQYAMEVWIDPSFRYDGKGWGTVNHRSRLWIAEWQRIRTIKNHLYELYLDSRQGLLFEDKTCFGPRDFGKWNRFTMTVRWSNDADGYLQVSCNGKVIYATTGPNAVPPDCGKPWKQQCKLEHIDLSEPVQWQVGPNLRGHGMDYARFGFPSPFPPFPKDGLQMKVRNLYYGKPRP